MLELFAEGRECYKQREFSKALEFFLDVLKVDPEDGPSKVYVERCNTYIQSPPPEGWDGVFEMQTK